MKVSTCVARVMLASMSIIATAVFANGPAPATPSCESEIQAALVREKCKQGPALAVPRDRPVRRAAKPVAKHPAPAYGAPPSQAAALPPPSRLVVPAVVSATPGCVEIHFTTKPEFGDSVVKFPIIGPSGSGIVKDNCTSIKRAGDSSFGPWRNEFCLTEAPILCDFSQHEKIIGQKVQLMGSYRIEKHGDHVLRLPAFMAARGSGYVTALILVRQTSKHPNYPSEQPGTTKAFAAAIVYGEQRQNWIDDNSNAIGVRSFDFENGVAKVWYTKTEVPKDSAQLYWPWKEWRGP